MDPDEVEEIVGSDDGDALGNLLMEFLETIGDEFPDICSYAIVVGDQFVDFAPDDDECEDFGDDEIACGKIWLRVVAASMVEVPDSWDGYECGTWGLTLEVGIERCFPVIADGEAPTSTTMTALALEGTRDVQTIVRAALGVEIWDSINVGAWTPYAGGGVYGGSWTFDVVTK